MRKKPPKPRSRPPEYYVWLAMKQRCYNPNNARYADYGGRGIDICARWLESFDNFIEDMGPRPSHFHQIDRYPDNNSGYRKDNCRWALPAQQHETRRKGKIMKPRPKTKPISRDAVMQKVMDERGLAVRIASACGIARAAVYQWTRIPVNRVKTVAPILKMKPREIRPDIF